MLFLSDVLSSSAQIDAAPPSRLVWSQLNLLVPKHVYLLLRGEYAMQD